MAVSRGGAALWVGCVRSQSTGRPIKSQSWRLSQASMCRRFGWARPLSSASWALAPPNSLRYQIIRQVPLSHPAPPRGPQDEDWGESVSVCVVVRQGELDRLHTLLEIPLTTRRQQGALQTPELSFPLTIVDGRREDDINVDGWQRDYIIESGFRKADVFVGRVLRHTARVELGCFRSLFEAERCPAPFAPGSRFYCFHSPEVKPAPSGPDLGHNLEAEDPPASLYSPAGGSEREPTEGEREREEKVAVMYERLRTELPGFFFRSHDYSMYSNDLEFINGLMNNITRGRLQYQLTLLLWRLLCLVYYVDPQLEVLKLTKHPEDGTIKARWRVRGLPFHSLLLRFYRKDKTGLYRTFDAISTFSLGEDGLINCHRVEKMMPSQPPVLPRVTSLIAGVLVALGVQDHRPALNLLPPLLSSIRHSRP